MASFMYVGVVNGNSLWLRQTVLTGDVRDRVQLGRDAISMMYSLRRYIY